MVFVVVFVPLCVVPHGITDLSFLLLSLTFDLHFVTTWSGSCFCCWHNWLHHFVQLLRFFFFTRCGFSGKALHVLLPSFRCTVILFCLGFETRWKALWKKLYFLCIWLFCMAWFRVWDWTKIRLSITPLCSFSFLLHPVFYFMLRNAEVPCSASGKIMWCKYASWGARQF